MIVFVLDYAKLGSGFILIKWMWDFVFDVFAMKSLSNLVCGVFCFCYFAKQLYVIA